MKLCAFLKNITRLIGGVQSNSTSSTEEASHLMTTLGGLSSVPIEDDDLEDSQKMTAFNDILKYNSKTINMGALPSNSFSSLQEIQSHFDHTVSATTVITPVITFKSLEMKATDGQDDVWKIPKLTPPAGSTGILVPGVSIGGNIIRTYPTPHFSSAEGVYGIDVGEIHLLADLSIDITDLVENVDYNFFMLYRVNFNAVGYDSQYEGCVTIETGMTKEDLMLDGYCYNYPLNVLIDDFELVERFDTPTTNGFENIIVSFYFIITDSAGTITHNP